MELKSEIVDKIYDNYKFIALTPVFAVIIDYSLTFYLAGDTSMITSWEASPFVRFAVIHNLMVPYLIAIAFFYYGASYAVLKILHNSDYYKFGVLLILTAEYHPCLRGLFLVFPERPLLKWCIHPFAPIHCDRGDPFRFFPDIRATCDTFLNHFSRNSYPEPQGMFQGKYYPRSPVPG